MPCGMTESEKRTLAWIGDAVLALFAREWILRQPQIREAERHEAYTLLTSNQFLSGLGEPTGVEASIGTRYREAGCEAAFAWIEAELVPLFKKQWNNRRRGGLSRQTG